MAYVDDHMQDGDIILVEKRETAEKGESVVAMISGERVTLKPPHYAQL
ncbi:MAG TPA: S24 family peptidase [Chromatiaceae bacterium]|nr:S24 family peptidase [Chromatiaceae bacterium]